MSGLWYRSSVFVFVFAAIGSIMTVVGYFTIEEMATESLWIVQLNRAMSVVVLWFVATLGFYIKRGVVRSKAAENRLNAMIENTVEGIISFDYRGCIRSFNRACEKIFGYRAEEVIGENIKILMSAPYHDEHDGYLKNYHDTGERKIIGNDREVEGKRKDGGVFPIDLSVSEVKVGDTVFYSGIVRNITERKAAEEELNQALSNLRVTNEALDQRTGQLQALLDGTVDGILTIDVAGMIQSFNRACEKIFGYRAEEVIGENIKILMPAPYHDEHDGYLKNYHDTGDRKIIGIGREVEGKRKDGSVFPIDLSVSEVKVGDTVFYSGIVRNITERKAAEEELNQALSNLRVTHEALDQRTGQLQALLDGTVDGILTIDVAGMIQSFNRACEKIFGYRAEEVIGENIKILMPAPYHDEHDGYLKNYHDTGDRKIIGIGREVEGKRKDGSVFPIDLSVSEVKVGDTVFYSGIVRDITEAKQAREALIEEKEQLRIQLEKNVSLSSEIDHRKEAEEKIRNAHAKLKRRTNELAHTNEELSQFTYAVSHDLKTPLRAINGYSTWLADDLADTLQDDHKDYIDGMREAVAQAERLIDDLLELSRIGRREEPTERIRLNDFFRNLVDFMNLDANIVIAEDLPEVNASPTLLTQIFQNLIINGITYNTSETKHIEIAHKALDSDYELFVRDNGIGIDPDFHKRVFQIFQRLHTREEFEGTGVGLAIVKKAVQQIGGGIRIESEPGAGSTFFVTIPHGGKIS